MKIPKYIYILIVIIIGFTIINCNSYKTSNSGANIEEQPLDISDNSIIIINDSILETQNVEFKIPSLYFLLDSAKCLPCEYELLYNFESYYSDTTCKDSISFGVIVTPKSDYINNINYLNSIHHYSFPLIIEDRLAFYKNNKYVDVSNNMFQYVYIYERNKLLIIYLTEEDLTYNIHRVYNFIKSILEEENTNSNA